MLSLASAPTARQPRPRRRGRTTARATVEMPDGTTFTIGRLTAVDADLNAKLRKNGVFGYRTIALSMAPHRLGGLGNLCTHSSPLCRKLCNHISSPFLASSATTDRRVPPVV